MHVIHFFGILGASFRNVDEIYHLAGCDRLTISPKFLNELEHSTNPVRRCLAPDAFLYTGPKIVDIDEDMFKSELAKDEMATDKLLEGIASFVADTIKLEDMVKTKMK